MSEQQPESGPESDALDEATENPGMNYGDPTVEGISDEALEDHSTGSRDS